jgi:glycosyltransferase involved in cell wall biosynthesis
MQARFEYNQNFFGGTEYQGKYVNENILKDLPNLRECNLMIAPGNASVLEKFVVGRPFVFWVHNLLGQFHPDFKQGIQNELKNYVNYWIVNSEYAKNQLSKYDIELDKIHVIPNGFEPLTYDSTKFEKVDKPKLVYISNPMRGLNLLLQAIKKVDEDFELEIYSDVIPDVLPDETKSLFEDERVSFFGLTPKKTVMQQLSKAHIHAYPSVYLETFCLSLVENMSAGNLNVVPNIGALKEIGGDTVDTFEWTPDFKEFLANNASVPTDVFMNFNSTEYSKNVSIYSKQLTSAIKKVKSGEFDPTAQVKFANETYSWEAVKEKWKALDDLIGADKPPSE